MRLMKTVVFGLLFAWFGCSGGGDTVLVIPDGGDSAPGDTGVERPADVVGVDSSTPDLAEELDLGTPDITVDADADTGPQPECLPGEGCFLDPCDENSDCQSGLCVEHMGEGVCTSLCQEECPPGWKCKQVGISEPDIVYACVSDFANLCKPCATTEGCKTAGGAEDVCLDYGPDGNFCGGGCESNDDCPWGFLCSEAVTVDGIGTKQCVAEAGTCPCTSKSVALSLTTPCEVSNELGTCTGQRVCTEEGLSDCDAGVPAVELCDGLDNDCDGDTDEPNEVDGDYVNLCDDGNDCTQDICNGEAGCDYVALDGDECKDGDPCTAADHCVQGVCVGDPVVCEDGNPCTDDFCTENGGCDHVPNHEPCDDGDPCTVGDECDEGACGGTAVPCDCVGDEDCAALEDGDLCNGTLVCNLDQVPYQCEVDPDTMVVCPEPTGDDAFCLASFCDPETGACSVVPAQEGLSCNDGNPCTAGETCQQGTCTGGLAVNCNDGNPCTDDTCDPDAGGCVNADNQAPCNDGDACTTQDQCVDGECVGTGAPVVCNDNNPCTADACDPQSGCQFVPVDSPCDDGNLCTEGDTCGNGTCLPGGLVECDDDNLCTNEVCKPAEGCVYTFNDLPCDDGDACTFGDQCSQGSCVAAGDLDCDDDNPCTADSCDPSGGCVHEATVAPCDDGNLCTLGDTCVDGMCVPGAPIDCDDDNVCTTDICEPDKGCTFAMNEVPCDDGDLCTTGDHCHLGSCISSGNLACDDNNFCTDDSCDPGAGCTFIANALPCSDGNPCTIDDVCAFGQCAAGVPLDCPQGWTCVDGGCELLCPLGLTNCDDTCVNLLTDPDHCGDCPVACADGEYCSNGQCAPVCPPTLTLCGDECTNTQWDPNHCGDCETTCEGKPHAATAFCGSGECGFICDEGYQNCNFAADDGCEVDLMSDSENCGECDLVCAIPDNAESASCQAGECAFACMADYKDCNLVADDGCEAHVLTDDTHCGDCNAPCAADEKCEAGQCVPKIIAATCADILTTQNMWGMSAKGVDLRAYTNSTLHYLGCPGDGCDPNQFYCNYNANNETLSFGSTSNEIRAVVDPNNANGDTMPNTYNGCCNGPMGLCNGPDANNNGVNVNNAQALCSALGYSNGILKRWQTSNSCPEAHVLDASGQQWTSDWAGSQGYGAEWQCVGFK